MYRQFFLIIRELQPSNVAAREYKWRGKQYIAIDLAFATEKNLTEEAEAA